MTGIVKDPTRCITRRLVAVLLDTLIVLVPLVLAGFLTGILRQHSQRLVVSIGWWGVLSAWAVGVLYWTLFERAPRGATPGKLLLGLRIVRADGSPQISTWQAIVRNVLRIPEQFICFVVGLVLALVTTGHRRLGDVAGRTLVVRRDAADAVEVTPWTTGVGSGAAPLSRRREEPVP